MVRSTPPSKEAVRDMMPTLFDLLTEEENAAVRVVMGHFIFVYIHPFFDGNRRMGWFVHVHPRGYGEHNERYPNKHPDSGSSPWVRGTRLPTGTQEGFIRFIPVGTGNTQTAEFEQARKAVHPRGYGEH